MPLASQVQETIQHLSHQERLYLIEQLAHDLRADYTRQVTPEEKQLESDLARMAADPQIQKEMRLIEQEFAPTEGNGLEAN